MTLDTPSVDVTVDHADQLTIESFLVDGSKKELKEKDIARFEKVTNLTKNYLGTLGAADALPLTLTLTLHSGIPPAIGLASSAAVFSAFAKAIAGLIKDQIELTDEQVSVIARLGSGSATRSIFGGYSTFVAGNGDGIGSGYGEQIADENHWLLHDIVIVPSVQEKKVGSTKGHASAHSSPHYAARVEAIRTRREPECIDAILTKDFEKLQQMAEEDALDMHHVMETQDPPLHYLNDVTHRIIGGIKELRSNQHLPVLFTMDAGPTVHLLCPDEAVEAIRTFAHAQEDCKIFEAKTGKGTHFV